MNLNWKLTFQFGIVCSLLVNVSALRDTGHRKIMESTCYVLEVCVVAIKHSTTGDAFKRSALSANLNNCSLELFESFRKMSNELVLPSISRSGVLTNR